MYPVIIIPARLESSRLPSKPLLPIPVSTNQSVPLIKWVYNRVQRATSNKVVVATDNHEIAKLFSHDQVYITDKTFTNGTERCYAVAKLLDLPDDCILMNWQGDEVTFDPKHIDDLLHIQSLVPDEICTACVKTRTHKQGDVYVVRGTDRRALYFSRYPIPHSKYGIHLKHVGIYTYTVKTLAKYCSFRQGILEKAESLEQLRILENGGSVYAEEFHCDSHSINYQEDYDAFQRRQQDLYRPR